MNFQADSLLKLVRTGGPSRKRRVLRRIIKHLKKELAELKKDGLSVYA